MRNNVYNVFFLLKKHIIFERNLLICGKTIHGFAWIKTMYFAWIKTMYFVWIKTMYFAWIKTMYLAWIKTMYFVWI